MATLLTFYIFNDNVIVLQLKGSHLLRPPLERLHPFLGQREHVRVIPGLEQLPVCLVWIYNTI